MDPVFTHDRTQFSLTPDGGLVFVDHEKNNRSGHFGHAMVQCANGDILCFYPNCNTDNNGHSGRGWMEYCRSTDGGETFDEAKPLPYSKALHSLNLGITSMNEKAVCTPSGTILLFNLICDVSENALWEPYFRPTFLRSTDNGHTWEDARVFCGLRGRIYDVMVQGEKIYVLMNPGWNKPEHVNRMRIYVSEDDGRRFVLHSVLPFREGTEMRYYGTMEQLPDGRIIVYTYNPDDEFNLEYTTTSAAFDGWSEPQKAHFAHRIRNPQMIRYAGAYFLFGRSGSFGEPSASGNLILYCSTDGINWDEGRVIAHRTAGVGAYSNTLLVRHAGRERVLYQASHAYRLNQTNILHFWLDAASTPEA